MQTSPLVLSGKVLASTILNKSKRRERYRTTLEVQEWLRGKEKLEKVFIEYFHYPNRRPGTFVYEVGSSWVVAGSLQGNTINLGDTSCGRGGIRLGKSVTLESIKNHYFAESNLERKK